MTTMRHGAFRSGVALFFFFSSSWEVPLGVDDPPVLRAAIVVKKKLDSAGLSTREFPMNLGGGSACFFLETPFCPGLLPCNSISLPFGEETQKTGDIW